MMAGVPGPGRPTSPARTVPLISSYAMIPLIKCFGLYMLGCPIEEPPPTLPPFVRLLSDMAPRKPMKKVVSPG